MTMRFDPSTRRGDGIAGGCISLIVLLVEIPVALLLVLSSVLRGWVRRDQYVAAPTVDWVPILWCGGFTLGVLVIAVIFLCPAHPFAAAVQLVLAVVALLFTIMVWHDQHERAHPGPTTGDVSADLVRRVVAVRHPNAVSAPSQGLGGA
ncbi:hypothetical protein AQI84_05555 [Streptomyces griseorubiginosus]|nr:hypothetical protein AQI84_05555 [Streptomyces griseorubiginosus]